MNAFKTLGLRINTDYVRTEEALIERARAIPHAAVVGDVANRLQAFPAGFTQYGGKKKFAGPALTVRVRPGDNLFLHKALDLALRGDVVVVDAGGGINTAIIGAMMTRYAKSRGIEAVVIDGAIRDVGELDQLDFPVVARAARHPMVPSRRGPARSAIRCRAAACRSPPATC